MPNRRAVVVFLASFGLVPQGFAQDPRMGAGPPRVFLANGLGSACEGERQLVDRALCFGRWAKAGIDVSICDEAKHPGVKYQCYYIYAQHRSDPAVCEKIPHPDLEDGCFSDLAASKDDPTLCQVIVGKGIKDSCYFKIAKARRSTALCAGIEDQALRRGCISEAGTAE